MTWTQTYTGLKFDFNDPEAHEYCLIDIAHHLSLICRYGGATKWHYSVAQHSLCMALKMWENTLNPYYALDCLIHDAAEAYVGDIKSPIKALLPQFVEVENRVDAALRKKLSPFGIMGNGHAKTKEYDRRIIVDEKKQIMATSVHDWSLPPSILPLGVNILDYVANQVEIAWLEWFGTFSREIIGEAAFQLALKENTKCLSKPKILT